MKLFVLIGIVLLIYRTNNIGKSTYSTVITPQEEPLKKSAFTILRNNCNSCHAEKRKVTVFTFANMDRYSNAINQQVFIRRKMPKGRKNKLKEKEEETLKKWITTLNNP